MAGGVQGLQLCATCAYQELSLYTTWALIYVKVASPFPSGVPKDENDLIIPARDGTLRALRAAKAAGTVKRVVITSSYAAIGYGQPDRRDPFTEEDWTPLENAPIRVPPYQKSKTVAERAAWDWIAKEGGEMELSVVNPVGIFGPSLSKNSGTSIEIIERLMKGQLPGLPQLSFGVVDVRDTADLHLRAMTDPAAKGERFLALAGDFVTFQYIAQTLRSRLGDKAKKVPTRVLPNFVLRIVAYWDRAAEMIVEELGKAKNASNNKAVTVLGWKPRSAEEAIIASAESLERLGVLK